MPHNAGAQNRRFITQVLRRELNIEQLLKERGFNDEGASAEDVEDKEGAEPESVLTVGAAL